MATSFENKFKAIKAIINKILMPIAMVTLVCSLLGYLPAGWFIYANLILVVWLATNCVYIMEAGLLGVPLIFGKVAHRTMKPGWNFYFPFVVDVVYLPTRKLKYLVTVEKIEANDTFHLDVNVTCQYQLNWDKAWRLVNHYQSKTDGYSLEGLVEHLRDYLKKIITSTYRGTDLDTFFANKVLQDNIEEQVQEAYSLKVEEELNKTCGFDVLVDILITTYEYTPDPKWLALSQAKQGAKQRKQEKITDAQAEQEATKIKADALNYALRQKADAEAYEVLKKGLQNAEVQKAIGQVLKDHPGLTLLEAVKHIPHYLSIGGSTNLDIAQFMAVLEKVFGPKPEDAETDPTSATTTSSSTTSFSPAEDADAEEIVEP